MNLSEVSRTAILTLTARAVESNRKGSGFNDPLAVLCLEKVMCRASEQEKARFARWRRMYEGLQARDAKARVHLAMSFDRIANQFISAQHGCTVINLACGLDTRFWRIENKKCSYIELDLPEMIALKRELLGEQLGYELIGCSVLDPAWIDRVTSKGNRNFLLLAEGLFMYLPGQAAAGLLREISHRFERSQFVLDIAPEKYTRGLWKKLIALESRVWDLEVSFVFGLKDPGEIESYGEGFKVIGQEKGSAGPIVTVAINAAC
jgi:O-methyltransferase involved in polyketide biosynthesis